MLLLAHLRARWSLTNPVKGRFEILRSKTSFTDAGLSRARSGEGIAEVVGERRGALRHLPMICVPWLVR